MSKRIAAFCSDLIASSGPLPLPELAARARAAGLTKARNPDTVVRSALSRADGFVLLPDQRYDAARRMLDGAVLTHRRWSGYSDGIVLYAGLELALLDLLLAEAPLRLATGGDLQRSIGGIDGWAGPPSWLPSVPGDNLIAFRLSAGVLTVEPVTDDPGVLEKRAERVRTVAARHLGSVEDSVSGRPDRRRALVAVMLRALAECPDLLAEAVPPLDETLRVPRPGWRPDRYYDGFGPPSSAHDLRPYDTPSSLEALLDDDDEEYGPDRPSPEDYDLDRPSCEELHDLYAGSPAGVVPLSGTRPAGPAGSSGPHTDRRPR